MLLANISRANNRRKNEIHEQKWFKFGWKYFIKSLMNNHAWFLTKIISIKILSTPIHIDSLRFSSIEDIHVIFRMSQLKALYILVTQSQRKYRRRRIPDAKKFYLRNSLLYLPGYRTYSIMISMSYALSLMTKEILNHGQSSHVKSKSSQRSNFPLWLYFLSKKVYKHKVCFNKNISLFPLTFSADKQSFNSLQSTTKPKLSKFSTN